MNKQTFGHSEQYKMLGFLINEINNIEEKRRIYLSSVINDFNKITKTVYKINDNYSKSYLLDLIHQDFVLRIDKNMTEKYNNKIISCLKNFIHAKIKNLKQYKNN